MRVLDLFSGIGGFSLGLERAGMRTVAFCEIDPFCRAVLAQHWPRVPIYDDVRELTAETLLRDGIAVDVICGGFPCQDVSLAGNGAGLDGERSGLWREYARLVSELRPKFVIVENVAALAGRGLGRVLGNLAGIGYDCQWDSFPTGLNFGHRRERMWLVAYPVRTGLSQRCGSDANGFDAPRIFTRERFAGLLAVSDPRQKWSDRPLLGRGVHGIPGRVGRVRACGNAVIPQIPEMIGRAIMAFA